MEKQATTPKKCVCGKTIYLHYINKKGAAVCDGARVGAWKG
jgi:hypothetical protein